MTERQKIVLAKVIAHESHRDWYRADSNGERVTLASLWRAGVLDRRAWRGKEGEPDAAHEYCCSDRLLDTINNSNRSTP